MNRIDFTKRVNYENKNLFYLNKTLKNKEKKVQETEIEIPEIPTPEVTLNNFYS